MMNKKKLLDYYLNLHYSLKIDYVSDDEDGYYVAHIPELGSGAFLGTGNTIKEAVEELENIKRSYFEDHIKKGIKIPLPKVHYTEKNINFSGKFLLRIPKLLHAKLSADAEKNGVSLNSYVAYLLSEYSERDRSSEKFDLINSKIDKILKNTNQIQQGMESLDFKKFDINKIPDKYRVFTMNVFSNENLPNEKDKKMKIA